MNVKIRKFQLDDAPVMALQFNNEKIWNNIYDAIPYPYTQKKAEEYIRISNSESGIYNFAIVCQENFCGVIGLRAQPDVHRRSVELGYWVAEKYWRKGVATQAISLMTEWGFSYLKINRIFARVFEKNTASKKALEKNGYILEGVLKKAIYKNSQFMDEYIYAKLRNG